MRGVAQHTVPARKPGGKMGEKKKVIQYLTCLLLSMFLHSIEAQVTQLPQASSASCNITAYNEWQEMEYSGLLATDPTFWRYQTQKQFVLTNGLALQLAVDACRLKFQLLKNFEVGRSGPIDIQTSYKSMCSSVCLQSDIIHQNAMGTSGCTCDELSTQPTDQAFHIKNDWCKHNSAQILCEMTGYCGVWVCAVNDFMCPRYEWDKKIIYTKGLGNCEKHTIKIDPKATSSAHRLLSSSPSFYFSLLGTVSVISVVLIFS